MKRNARKHVASFVISALLLMSVASVLGSGQAVRAESASFSGAAEKTTSDYDKPQNPIQDQDGNMIWDTIYFGSYWQKDNNGDGKADKEDAKEPIRWRVLSVEGDDAFLVTDQNIDVQPYNTTGTDVTWEKCTMRSWLNGYGAEENEAGIDYTRDCFAGYAFNAFERSAIITTNVENKGNPEYGTEGGNNTEDRVFLLSAYEVTDASYGFTSSATRETSNTEYVIEQGAYTSTEGESVGNGWWWLRSPGENSKLASYIGTVGEVYLYGSSVNDFKVPVHAALHLNLSHTQDWQMGKPISAEGEAERPGIPTLGPVVPIIPLPIDFPTLEPTSYPTLTPPSSTPMLYPTLTAPSSTPTPSFIWPYPPTASPTSTPSFIWSYPPTASSTPTLTATPTCSSIPSASPTVSEPSTAPPTAAPPSVAPPTAPTLSSTPSCPPMQEPTPSSSVAPTRRPTQEPSTSAAPTLSAVSTCLPTAPTTPTLTTTPTRRPTQKPPALSDSPSTRRPAQEPSTQPAATRRPTQKPTAAITVLPTLTETPIQPGARTAAPASDTTAKPAPTLAPVTAIPTASPAIAFPALPTLSAPAKLVDLSDYQTILFGDLEEGESTYARYDSLNKTLTVTGKSQLILKLPQKAGEDDLVTFDIRGISGEAGKLQAYLIDDEKEAVSRTMTCTADPREKGGFVWQFAAAPEAETEAVVICAGANGRINNLTLCSVMVSVESKAEDPIQSTASARPMQPVASAASVAPMQAKEPSVSQNGVSQLRPAKTKTAQEKDGNDIIRKKAVKAPGRVKGLTIKGKKRMARLKWKKVSKAKGYQIQLSMTKKFRKKIQKTTKKTFITVNYQKGNKKYFVRVRAYTTANGKKLYGKWSQIKRMKFQ